ncbi:MAG: hypothetical protein MUC28_01050 [Planctomycetes bacterium]|jgi:hypothetical protein|nr:hypothetical protein [Planctomycetota bacterium]
MNFQENIFPIKPKLTLKALEEIRESFNSAEKKFYNNEPDFSKIEEIMKEIRQELRKFKDDFLIVFREDPGDRANFGQKNDLIDAMKDGVFGLENKIIQAGKIIDDNKYFEPYRKQIKSAEEIVEILKKI